MAIQLLPLPYPIHALEPCISRQTLEFHYGKHHRKYVTTLNELIRNTPMDTLELEAIIIESAHSRMDIFNNAAQSWNHAFFWHCLTPQSSDQPGEDCMPLINKCFGSFDNFKTAFTQSAKKLFGSGYTWLVKNHDGTLSIQNLENAGTPLVQDKVPLLTCDVWEHSYYLDYKNDRERYLENFWKIVNWEFVETNLQNIPVLRSKYKGQEDYTHLI
jgi:Fe-Mn family superoxide dismutase